MTDRTYTGGCFCGAVRIAASGNPVAMGYCHCESCRWWSAAPVNAFTLWPASNVKVTKGEDQLGVYQKTERSLRKFCRACGGHVMTLHPSLGLIDIYAAIVRELAFEPELHVFYGEATLPIRDGLPKFRDLPAKMGGSGDMLPE
ncbi:MAG: GFA family protein [Alphaproteobacteria bacterium]